MKKWFCLLAVSSIFVGCESKEDDQIYSAQICLNSATSATVDACLAKIAGVSSSRAFVIRCSAEFIRANITTSTIVAAIENIEDNDSGNTVDPTIEFYQNFSFSSGASADVAVTNCDASGSEGLRLLALSAKSATTIKTFAGGDIATWINTNPDLSLLDPAEVQSMGSNVLQMQSIACDEGGSLKGTEICDNINNAIANAGGDVQAIGEAFINQLKNPDSN